MNLSDIYTGLSLHFDAPLEMGSGNVEFGEFMKSSAVSGSLVPTPAGDWATLKRLFSLPDPSASALPKPFAVSYVPYREGRIHYHQGTGAVLSAEYSGCLMAVYTDLNGQRRVAHVPKANSIDNDCIGEFRDYFAAHSTLADPLKAAHVKGGHRLTHFFQPFLKSRDEEIQFTLIGKLMAERMITEPKGFSVFGLVTAPDNSCVTIWAVKPNIQPSTGEMWHVLSVRARAPVIDFRALFDKTNRAAR
jgi:hypothetical protein